jgi:intracellular sulfur oxidation DsrE/DsrF family protein
MRLLGQIVATIIVLMTGITFASGSYAAESGKPHRIAIQVDQSDPALMNLVLNNVSNVLEHYHGKNEDVQIEVVAYGPGLNMLREDKSPVKERIKRIAEGSFPSKVSFSACGNAMQVMEKAEGQPVPIITQASVVPAGVVRLSELQEQGWSYIRP